MTNESQNKIDALAKWGSIVTPIGVGIVLLLQTQFVSRKEFSDASDKLGDRVATIEKVLVQMAEAAKQNDRQDISLADHERRIRALEMHHE
jgi:hypothetical protein